MRSIGDYLNGKQNNFDFLRFLAATLVIVSHSFPLTGFREIAVLHNTLGGHGVFIFFLISGFLITRSYLASNNVFLFFKARLLRIFPALIVVILLTIFVLGPAVTSIPLDQYFANKSTYQMLNNILLHSISYKLPGVFEQNPYKYSVNGSLWTLKYEFTFYIFVAVLGVLTILKRKEIIILLFVLSC